MLTPILCLCLALADSAEPLAAELVTRSYPLSAILMSAPTVPLSFRVAPIRSAYSNGFADDVEPADSFSADALLDLLANTIAPEQWEYEGRSLEIWGPDRSAKLHVTAPLEIHGEIARYLNYLREVVSQRMHLHVDVYHVTKDPTGVDIPSGVLGRDESDRLKALRRSGTIQLDESFDLPLTSGVPSSRRSTTTVTYLRDVDVEIAQAAAVHDPIYDSYELGTAATFRAERDSSGRALVSYVVRHAWQAGPPDEMSIDAPGRLASERGAEPVSGTVSLQSPRVSFATIAGSIRLDAQSTGVAFAASPTDMSGASGVIVAMTLESIPAPVPPFQSGDRQLVILDVCGDFSSGLEVSLVDARALDMFMDMAEDHCPYAIPLGPFSGEGRGALEQAVESTLNHDFGEDIHVDIVANYLIVAGPTKAVDQVLRVFREQLPERGSTGCVTIQEGTVPTNDARLLLGLTATVGDAFAICGTQETYLFDYDMDVANNMSITNPAIDVGTDGLVARVRVAPYATGQSAIGVTLVSHLREGGKNAFNARSSDFGVLHQPAFLTTSIDQVTILAPGGVTSIGTIRKPGGGSSLIVLGASKTP